MERGEIGSARPVGGFGAGPGPDAAGMDPERSGSAPLPCTLQPAREPGFVPVPFFLRHDSPVSWDLCDPLPAAESPGSWESSLLWDGGSLVFANSSQGQPGTPGGAFSPTPPPLDPAGFPLPELWTGPHMDAPPAAAPDPTLPPVAAACLDPTDGPPTSKTNPDLGEVLAYVSHTLSCHRKGMRVKPLMKRLLKEHGVDLLAFSQDGGYQGVVSFLQEVPGIELWNPEKGEKCRVLSCTFKKSAAVKPPAPQPPSAPPSARHSSSPPPDAPAPHSRSVDQGPTGAPGETPDLAEVLACVRDVLGRFPLGLKVGKLKEALRSERGLDLEELSRQRGCGDALHLLQALPHLWLGDPGKGDACLARLSTGATVKPPAPQPPPDPAAPSAWHGSGPLPDAPAPPLQPADGEPRGAPGETPDLAEVLACVRDVLGRFPLGLKVGKLKEALRSERGLDLEELSRQRGCGDALHLLRALPHLWLGDPGKGDACLARLSADAAVNAPAPSRPAEAGGWALQAQRGRGGASGGWQSPVQWRR
nr:uncharacterized protein LOC125627931 isoform X4 [Caretta caretta]